MKLLIIILTFLFTNSFSIYSQTNPKHIYVNSYYRKDGTFVQGHFKTTPNYTNLDNFSTKGNVNPYTYKQGWIEPDNKIDYSKTPSTYSSSPQSNNVYPSNNTNINYPNLNVSYHNNSANSNTITNRTITYLDGQECFNLCIYCNDLTYNNDLEYYWYSETTGIQKSKGYSSGYLLDGNYKFIDENGKLLVESNFQKGLEHGNYIIWDENGLIKEKMHFTNGILDYAKFENNDHDIIEFKGELFKIGSIKNVYNSIGTLIETSTYLNDFKCHHKLYFESGVQLQFEYTKGFINKYFYDTYKEYFSNGNLKISGQFIDNIKDGIWYYYNEDGTFITIQYNIYTEKYINDNLKIKGGQFYDSLVKKWIKYGKWIYFKEDGESWDYVKYFENGIEIEK